MTDGMFLQLVKGADFWVKYKCIIIDEVHERTIPTGLLLAWMKLALPLFPEMKLVIMSATHDVGIFLNYFDQPGHLCISGREHPVEIRYLQEPTPDYASLALNTAKHIHDTTGDGDILLFMPSISEIEAACVQLRSAAWGLEVLPLHSQLSKVEQDRVFRRSSRRRCIISTNIAEANVTVDGVAYIIDTGLAIESRYNPRIGLKQILTGPISKTAAQQRASRAGRMRPGVCYRLYTEENFNQVLLPTTPASILINDLSRPVLQLKAIVPIDIANYSFIETPDPEAFLRALEDLLAMGYLDDSGKAQRASDEGRYIDMQKWCSEASLSMRALEEFKRIRMKVRKSFADLFNDNPSGHDLPEEESNDKLRQALAWAFSHHVAFSDVGSGDNHYRVLHHNWHAGLSPESNLFDKNHKWLIYDSFVMTNFQFLSTVTAIEPKWLRGSKNFQEDSWAMKRGGQDGSYKMPLAKASFEEACEEHSGVQGAT
ncbi:hypothetical protein IL306_015043 [Fusarium sp. DS 682]|nr:hypothetical protein IL306_015043 [Fusarium sp. DS 682]